MPVEQHLEAFAPSMSLGCLNGWILPFFAGSISSIILAFLLQAWSRAKVATAVDADHHAVHA